MKYYGISLMVTVLLIGVGLGALRSQGTSPSYVPENGFVPNRETAVRVGEAIVIPIYGKKQLLSERPFSARLKAGVWTVTGHLPEPSVGGVAQVRISKETCQIISVTHGE